MCESWRDQSLRAFGSEYASMALCSSHSIGSTLNQCCSYPRRQSPLACSASSVCMELVWPLDFVRRVCYIKQIVIVTLLLFSLESLVILYIFSAYLNRHASMLLPNTRYLLRLRCALASESVGNQPNSALFAVTRASDLQLSSLCGVMRLEYSLLPELESWWRRRLSANQCLGIVISSRRCSSATLLIVCCKQTPNEYWRKNFDYRTHIVLQLQSTQARLSFIER